MRAVEEAEGPFAAGERLEPDFQSVVGGVAQPLHAQRVLVDGDDVAVGHDGRRLVRHGANVVAKDQRRSHHAPHREVRTVLIDRHAVAHLEHVGVVPVTRTGIAAQSGVVVEILHHGAGFPVAREDRGVGERKADVACRTPHVADLPRPGPRLAVTPLAHGEKDRAPGGAQGVAHERIGSHGIDILGVAPVVFQVVDAPAGVLQRILVLVAEAAETSGAGPPPGIGVDTQLQPLRMHVIGQRLHTAREPFGIALRKTVGVAFGGVPAVVDIEVNVSGLGQPRLDQRVGHFADHPLIDVAAELVPRAPAHRRRIGQAFPLLGRRGRRAAERGAKE